MRFQRHLDASVPRVHRLLRERETWEDFVEDLGVDHAEVALEDSETGVSVVIWCRQATREVPKPFRALLPGHLEFSIRLDLRADAVAVTGDVTVSADVKEARFAGTLHLAPSDLTRCVLTVQGQASNRLSWPLEGTANSLIEKELVIGSLEDLVKVLKRRLGPEALTA